MGRLPWPPHWTYIWPPHWAYKWPPQPSHWAYIWLPRPSHWVLIWPPRPPYWAWTWPPRPTPYAWIWPPMLDDWPTTTATILSTCMATLDREMSGHLDNHMRHLAHVWPMQPYGWQANTLGIHVAAAARGLASHHNQTIGQPPRPEDWMAVTANLLNHAWPSRPHRKLRQPEYNYSGPAWPVRHKQKAGGQRGVAHCPPPQDNGQPAPGGLGLHKQFRPLVLLARLEGGGLG